MLFLRTEVQKYHLEVAWCKFWANVNIIYNLSMREIYIDVWYRYSFSLLACLLARYVVQTPIESSQCIWLRIVVWTFPSTKPNSPTLLCTLWFSFTCTPMQTCGCRHFTLYRAFIRIPTYIATFYDLPLCRTFDLSNFYLIFSFVDGWRDCHKYQGGHNKTIMFIFATMPK